MVMSDFGLEVERWPIRACTMKNMQYNLLTDLLLLIVDLAMGQIPHSTEHIFSCLMNTTEWLKHEEIGKFFSSPLSAPSLHHIS